MALDHNSDWRAEEAEKDEAEGAGLETFEGDRISRFSTLIFLLCIAIPKFFVVFRKFHAALDNCATVACCAADMAAIATRPYSVRR